MSARNIRTASPTTGPSCVGCCSCDLGSAEGEDPLHQLGGAVHRPPHLVEVLLDRMAGAEVHRRQFEVAADRRQQVVEVVGDAAGQRAHRLHLLRLPELGLEPLAGLFGPAPLGDVDGGADVAGEGAAGVDARDAVRRHPAILAIGAARAGIDLEGLPLLQGAEEDGGPDLPVVGVQEIGPAVGRYLVKLPPEEGNPPLVDEIGLAQDVRGPHHHRRRVGQGAEALFALPQRGFGPLAIGDVDHHAAQCLGPAVDDVDRHPILEPDDAAVGGDHPVVELVVAARLGAFDAVADGRLAIDRMDVVRPEIGVVQPLPHRIPEQALGLRADEREPERLRVRLPDDAVDRGDELGHALAGGASGLLRLDAGGDVLDEQDDAPDGPCRVVPGLHFPAQPDGRSIGERHPLLLDFGGLPGEAPFVRHPPVVPHVRVDVVVAAAQHGLPGRRVGLDPAAVHREVAHLAVEHRQASRRVIQQELEPLVAVAQAVDHLGVLGLAVAHARLRGLTCGTGRRRGKT